MEEHSSPLSWGYIFFLVTFLPVMCSKSLALFICYGIAAIIWTCKTTDW